MLRELDEKHVLLVDGRRRPVSRPKKKNKIHLQHYERRADLGDPPEIENLSDSEVIRFLKELVPVSGTPEEEV